MMSVGHSKFFGVENAADHRAARSPARQANCRMAARPRAGTFRPGHGLPRLPIATSVSKTRPAARRPPRPPPPHEAPLFPSRRLARRERRASDVVARARSRLARPHRPQLQHPCPRDRRTLSYPTRRPLRAHSRRPARTPDLTRPPARRRHRPRPRPTLGAPRCPPPRTPHRRLAIPPVVEIREAPALLRFEHPSHARRAQRTPRPRSRGPRRHPRHARPRPPRSHRQHRRSLRLSLPRKSRPPRRPRAGLPQPELRTAR